MSAPDRIAEPHRELLELVARWMGLVMRYDERARQLAQALDGLFAPAQRR